jgi:hypothetical protein
VKTHSTDDDRKPPLLNIVQKISDYNNKSGVDTQKTYSHYETADQDALEPVSVFNNFKETILVHINV